MNQDAYATKFAGFVRMCDEAKTVGFEEVIVRYPNILGDNYEEIIESLSRLADANLGLRIVTR